MMELRNTPASSLDKFIKDNLLSNTEFRTQVNQAIDTICTFLKERCFRLAPRPIRVSKVVKVSPELPHWGEAGLVSKPFHSNREQEVEVSRAGGF